MFLQDVFYKQIARSDLGVNSQRERPIVANVAYLPNGFHLMVRVVFVLLAALSTAEYLRAGFALDLNRNLHGFWQSNSVRFIACQLDKERLSKYNDDLRSIVPLPVLPFVLLI